MTTSDWSELEPLVASADYKRLTQRLMDLDDADRKALVKPMRAYSRSGEFGAAPRRSENALTLVGVAVLPDARSTSAWLRRFPAVQFSMWPDERDDWVPTTSLVVRILAHRRPGWVPALVQDLAERLRTGTEDSANFEVVDGLRLELGLQPPEVGAYVAQWVQGRWSLQGHPSGSEVLAENPAFARLVPLVFDDDAIASRLRSYKELSTVIADGLVDRGAVLDSALARLQRGGRPRATNDFVAVLEDLAPTDDEVGARLSDYLALLPSGTASTVASSAQAALLRAEASGAINSSDVIAASSAVLARSEKKVLRTQLGWLERHARNHPRDAQQVAAAATVATSSSATDISQRATALVTSLGHTPPPSNNSGAFDPQVALAAPQDPAPVLPMESLDEAIEQLLVILRTQENHAIGLQVERVLEALPRLAGNDASALLSVKHRFVEDPAYVWAVRGTPYGDRLSVRRAMAAVTASLVGDAWTMQGTDRAATMDPPERALAERIVDLATALRRDQRVRVVSLPTDDSGAIDPDVLARRLASAAQEGWQPASLDLEQAQLRADPHDHPMPQVTVLSTTALSGAYHDPSEQPDQLGSLTLVGVAPAEVDTVATATIWSLLVRNDLSPRRYRPGWAPENHFAAWHLLLPHHPDLITAHLVPELSRVSGAKSQGLQSFLKLAESPRGGGVATNVALAHLLNGANSEAQSAAADAILALAARDHLDATQLGRLLTAMIRGREITTKRLPKPLLDAAHNGAQEVVWNTLRQVITDLLATGDTINGMADVLACAANVAVMVPEPQAVPRLDELAARKGKSMLVTEAKRLLALLSTPGS